MKITEDDITGTWSERIQTKDGRKVRILVVDMDKSDLSNLSVVAAVRNPYSGGYHLYVGDRNGKQMQSLSPGAEITDFVEKPKLPETPGELDMRQYDAMFEAVRFLLVHTPVSEAAGRLRTQLLERLGVVIGSGSLPARLFPTPKEDRTDA